MKRYLLIIVILPFYAWYSCTREVDIKMPFPNQSVVVNALFTPDNPFVFHFSGTYSPIEKEATIKDSIHLMLYENDVKVLDTKFLSDSLVSDVYPKHGAAYLMKVFVEGHDTIYAADTIPQQVSIQDASVIWSIAIDQYNTHVSQVNVTFTDPPGEQNYYELFIGNSTAYNGDAKITDPVLINEGDAGFFPGSFFFSDELFEGKTYTLTVNVEIGSGSREVNVVLRNISRNYYLYRKYWARHRFNQVAIDREVGNLLYMGEPIAMFNNIVNGYGIFAGYVTNDPVNLRTVTP